jgi:hypothetical protein
MLAEKIIELLLYRWEHKLHEEAPKVQLPHRAEGGIQGIPPMRKMPGISLKQRHSTLTPFPEQ